MGKVRGSYMCIGFFWKYVSEQSGAIATLLCALALTGGNAWAEEDADEKFALSAGAYKVFRYESTALLTSRDFGLGVAFSPEDVLGLDSQQTVARLEGSWQFRPRHALTVSWYEISATNSLNLRRDIEWTDGNGEIITIPIGAAVESALNYNILKLGYLWSFYQSDKVDLSVGAGLHMTEVSLDLRAETTSSGGDARRGDTTVPLPVVTFSLMYNVSPTFEWFLKTQLFSLSFNDWSGTYSDVLFGAEYRLWKKVGVGLALSGNSLRIEEENADTRFEFENRISGLMAYFRWHF